MIKPREIPAGEFKARCLALLDEVATSGQEIVVTKRGVAVARVAPLAEPESLAGSITHETDIVSPLGGPWMAE